MPRSNMPTHKCQRCGCPPAYHAINRPGHLAIRDNNGEIRYVSTGFRAHMFVMPVES